MRLGCRGSRSVCESGEPEESMTDRNFGLNHARDLTTPPTAILDGHKVAPPDYSAVVDQEKVKARAREKAIVGAAITEKDKRELRRTASVRQKPKKRNREVGNSGKGIAGPPPILWDGTDGDLRRYAAQGWRLSDQDVIPDHVHALYAAIRLSKGT
jgi:hypothetical protein